MGPVEGGRNRSSTASVPAGGEGTKVRWVTPGREGTAQDRPREAALATSPASAVRGSRMVRVGPEQGRVAPGPGQLGADRFVGTVELFLSQPRVVLMVPRPLASAESELLTRGAARRRAKRLCI